jgi:nucleoside-diphosphate-sugar epimerase
VSALVRRPEAAGFAKACGADICTADIFNPDSLRAALTGCTVAINLATSLPGPSGRGDFQANDELRRNGTPIWIEACRSAGVPRIIQQSIAMVNAAGDTWADEETVCSAAGDEVAVRAIEAALAMEQSARLFLGACIILRGGLFYGPGTGFDDDWFSRAKTGKLRLPGNGEGFVSLIHISDMAAATTAVIDRWADTPNTLVVVDNMPARWREIFSYVAQLAGSAEPASGGRLGFPSFRVRNTRARTALGWAPHYPDYRAGLTR